MKCCTSCEHYGKYCKERPCMACYKYQHWTPKILPITEKLIAKQNKKEENEMINQTINTGMVVKFRGGEVCAILERIYKGVQEDGKIAYDKDMLVLGSSGGQCRVFNTIKRHNETHVQDMEYQIYDAQNTAIHRVLNHQNAIEWDWEEKSNSIEISNIKKDIENAEKMLKDAQAKLSKLGG